MGAISIRGLDENLSTLLKQKAKATRKSVNQLVLNMIERDLGVSKDRRFTREYDDLDDLFGTWSDEEFNQIQGKVDQERRIDEELWR